MIKVKNMTSQNGNDIPNQFEIYTPKGKLFQSYNSPIVFKFDDGRTYLDGKYWNYSRTTSKYRSQFLNETTKETKKKIELGVYKLVDITKIEIF